MFSLSANVCGGFLPAPSRTGKYRIKKNPSYIAFEQAYMAGNSIQQYFPRVRYETKNGHTSLILDGREQIRCFGGAERQKQTRR